MIVKIFDYITRKCIVYEQVVSVKTFLTRVPHVILTFENNRFTKIYLDEGKQEIQTSPDK